MAHVQASDRLTSEDAAFLYFEKDEMPLHIGSVSIFDGDIPFETLVEFVESRLPLIPRYRQRLVVPPFHIGHPTWESDPDFDIRNHISRRRLKRGTEAELRALAGTIFSRIMDRSRPVWDLVLVDGLKGGGSALIWRVHHCLVDGVSGAGLMNVLLNASGDAPTPLKREPYYAPPLPGPETSLTDALASAYSDLVDRVLATQSAALNILETLASDQAARGIDQLLRLVPELLTPVERLPFNQPLTGPRRLAWTTISIPEVKEIREVCGGTLNDVVLTVLTSAIRCYAELHGVSLNHRLLRLMVPVSLRRPGAENGVGNRVSYFPVSIPLDIANPRKLLNAVRERTEALKNAHVADLLSLISTWVGTTPAPIQALLGPVASMLPLPPFNLVCTNVPGPPFPLYALGRKMLTYHPYVPIGSEMGVGCAIQSYDHKLYIGLTGDAGAAPDVDRLRKFMEEAFAALRRAAGVAGPRKSARRAVPVAAVVPAARKSAQRAVVVPAVVAGPPKSAPRAAGPRKSARRAAPVRAAVAE
jgi:WS/DGAT/MGAT family acyltransferase